MRNLVFVSACLICIGHARRVQSTEVASEDDSRAFGQYEPSQSLIQLVQSAMSPVDKLKSDILSILRKDLNWKSIAKYIMVADHKGNTLYGIEENKWLCKVLRTMARKFVVKDFKVDFAEDHVIQSEWVNGKKKKSLHTPGLDLITQWTISLDTKKGWFATGDPIVLEGEILLRFNNHNQVAFAQVKNCFVNGLPVVLWPEVSSTQKLKTNMEKVQIWIEDVKALSSDKARSILKDDSYVSVFNVGSLPETQDVEKVMDTLKKDFANVFNRLPDVSIFAENFTTTDQAGKELAGIEANQHLFQLLRQLSGKFRVFDFRVLFTEVSGMYSAYAGRRLQGKSQMPYDIDEQLEGSVLQATWRLELGDKKGKTNTIVIEAATIFQINVIDDEIKVDRVKLQQFNVNGLPLEAWPQIELSDDLTNSTATVREWVDSMKPQIEVVDEVAEGEDNSDEAA